MVIFCDALYICGMIKENYTLKIDPNDVILPPRSKLLTDARKLDSVRKRVKVKIEEINKILEEE